MHGFEIAVETNGTLPPPRASTGSASAPRPERTLVQQPGDELKLVFPQAGAEPERFERLDFRHFFLQPMDGPEREANTQPALHTAWRIRAGG